MMMLIFYMVFMIPILLLDFWWIYQILMMFVFLFIFKFNFYNFYSGLSYFFGLDYLSYMLIFLCLFISMLMIISSMNVYGNLSMSIFVFVCFLINFILFLFFICLNYVLLYIFFELTLFPLTFLILGWGYQPERLISGLYLFFYTLGGSLPLLMFIFFIYNLGGSLFIDFSLSLMSLFSFNLFMMIAFLVKLPMFMFHFWLPKAHVQAPVSGSMILAGLMLKVGGYGIIRFMCLDLLFFYNYSFVWFCFGLLGSIYISLICYLQSDMKCMIAYSSISHMGLCLLGILSLTKFGILGSLFMMISHGLCSSGLFCLANLVYERSYSRSFYLNKGLIFFMPSMSLFWFMFCSFNMGCPPSLNFFSEIFIMISMVSYWSKSFYYIFFIIFFSSCFSFYLYSYSQHGLFSNFYSYSYIYVREFLLIFIHLVPIFMVIFHLCYF